MDESQDNDAKLRAGPKGVHIELLNLYATPKKCKLIYTVRESRPGVAPGTGMEEGKISEGRKESFGSDGYVQYLNCGYGFTCEHIYRDSSNCTVFSISMAPQ